MKGVHLKFAGNLWIPGGRIDVSDPCYDRDVWCMKKNLEVLAGSYRCFYQITSPEYEGRIVSCEIIHETMASSACKDKNFLCSIGVDAGLAGFFIAPKKEFDNEEWGALCKAIDGENVYLDENMFFTSSGFGDSEYPVYVVKDEMGRVCAVQIVFLMPNDVACLRKEYENKKEDLK